MSPDTIAIIISVSIVVLAIAIIVVPFLTVGHYKNKKYIEEHPECEMAETDEEKVSAEAEVSI